ncbi:MAG TPA: hypothetical protein VI818_04330, partial [Candidatus Thermoplasmatota archaeon]|nr:hypothetical protein [Candidatus Thermoplasmatota archaeon]
ILQKDPQAPGGAWTYECQASLWGNTGSRSEVVTYVGTGDFDIDPTILTNGTLLPDGGVRLNVTVLVRAYDAVLGRMIDTAPDGLVTVQLVFRQPSTAYGADDVATANPNALGNAWHRTVTLTSAQVAYPVAVYAYAPLEGKLIVRSRDFEWTAPPDPFLPACADGADNDADGATDYPADAGCLSMTDGDESDRPSDNLTLEEVQELSAMTAFYADPIVHAGAYWLAATAIVLLALIVLRYGGWLTCLVAGVFLIAVALYSAQAEVEDDVELARGIIVLTAALFAAITAGAGIHQRRSV